MAYTRLNLTNDMVLTEEHLSHFEDAMETTDAKLTDMESSLESVIDRQQEVYDAGVSYADEHISESNSLLESTLYGTDSGGKSWYDNFWDNVQQNGNRTSYSYGFAGESWTDETYNPKYDIYCGSGYTGGLNSANNLFAYSSLTDTKVTIIFNTTRNTSAFVGAKVVRIPLIKLIGDVLFNSTFSGTSNLEYIRFEGAIQNNIDFSSCSKLTHDSLMDIIEHLGSVSATRTCALGSTNIGKLMDTEKAIATQKGWTLA